MSDPDQGVVTGSIGFSNSHGFTPINGPSEYSSMLSFFSCAALLGNSSEAGERFRKLDEAYRYRRIARASSKATPLLNGAALFCRYLYGACPRGFNHQRFVFKSARKAARLISQVPTPWFRVKPSFAAVMPPVPAGPALRDSL